MTTLTVRFPRIYGAQSYSSTNIGSLIYCLQMIWIYAFSVSTKMVNLFSIMNWSLKKNVRYAMRVFNSPEADCSSIHYSVIRVFTASAGSGPNPTSIGFFHLFEKSLNEIFHFDSFSTVAFGGQSGLQ